MTSSDSLIRNDVMKRLLILSSILLMSACNKLADVRTTYCNPLDLDYTYMIYNSDRNLSYRSGADPAVVEFRGEYYMFVTRSLGYWHSTDLTSWEFITPKSIWYPQGCNAPAAHNYKDSLLYVTGDPSGSMSILYTDDPKSGVWKAEPAILHDLQDPDLFIDDDGQAYMFWGSSNYYPIRGKKLNMRDRFLVESETFELFNTDSTAHGWERFGENHSDRNIRAYIEGAWMTKHNGRYYMQYGAPGTEFNVYGDGVYVADDPMGPYEYQAHNPVSYKPGGFMNGAGHGSTVLDIDGNYWHFATMSLSAIVNWERRICLFPTFFDEDGIMYCDNEYGDYPHYAPSQKGKKGAFTGWMLLSYGKPVTSSSYSEGAAKKAEGFSDANRPVVSLDFKPANITDENCKTYWLARNNDDKEWICIDMQGEYDVYALQINFFDHEAMLYGRPERLRQRYVLEGSLDGRKWFVIEDRTDSDIDAPNAYIQLPKPVKSRYVRYRNIKVSAPYLAVSDIRVFGKGNGDVPAAVTCLTAERSDDGKAARLSWSAVEGAQGYNVRWGIAPDKLYSSWLLYDKSELDLRCLVKGQVYFVQVEAFNENGISQVSETVRIDN